MAGNWDRVFLQFQDEPLRQAWTLSEAAAVAKTQCDEIDSASTIIADRRRMFLRLKDGVDVILNLRKACRAERRGATFNSYKKQPIERYGRFPKSDR